MINFFRIAIILTFVGCGQKNDSSNTKELKTEDCKTSIKSYEFGRELYAISSLNQIMGGPSLPVSEARRRMAESIGVSEDVFPNNECVIRGFKDAEMGKESPYNKEGLGWGNFTDESPK